MKETRLDYPVTITSIEAYFDETHSLRECGALAAVRPCGETYDGKTYLGVLLGDLQRGAHITTGVKEGVLCVLPDMSPAIFVPTLKKIVYGYECWWRRIDTAEYLRQITDDDIGALWYVKAFLAMAEDHAHDYPR